MKAAVTLEAAPALSRARVLDYLALTKPRIAVLVLFTVGAGVLLAAGRGVDGLLLLNTVIGAALVASGASALNQWLERGSDGRMHRTANRPLPAGRLQPGEVFVFGTALTGVGLLYLLVTAHVLAALVAAFTFVTYVGVYTPLKRRSTLNTLVGAVPGALPPVIGWTAVRGTIDPEAVVLFLLVFLWQVPHFLAIAWMYRADYARAGLRMLPVEDPHGVRTAQQMVSYCVALLPVSLAPGLLEWGGPVYMAGATLLGVAFVASTVVFAVRRSLGSARRVLQMSLIYLPAVLGLLLLQGLWPRL